MFGALVENQGLYCHDDERKSVPYLMTTGGPVGPNLISYTSVLWKPHILHTYCIVYILMNKYCNELYQNIKINQNY
jgi:hypothetical protein